MKKNHYTVRWMLVTACCLALTGCGQVSLYEKTSIVPGSGWKSDFQPSGSFDITDTAAAYKVYFVLRHTDQYRHENIWVNIGWQAPGDSMRYTRYNVQLTNGGQSWEGTGMNDIWEIRKLLQADPQPFKKAGTWKFAVQQLMRDNPLQQVLGAGIRVEKL